MRRLDLFVSDPDRLARITENDFPRLECLSVMDVVRDYGTFVLGDILRHFPQIGTLMLQTMSSNGAIHAPFLQKLSAAVVVWDALCESMTRLPSLTALSVDTVVMRREATLHVRATLTSLSLPTDHGKVVLGTGSKLHNARGLTNDLLPSGVRVLHAHGATRHENLPPNLTYLESYAPLPFPKVLPSTLTELKLIAPYQRDAADVMLGPFPPALRLLYIEEFVDIGEWMRLPLTMTHLHLNVRIMDVQVNALVARLPQCHMIFGVICFSAEDEGGWMWGQKALELQHPDDRFVSPLPPFVSARRSLRHVGDLRGVVLYQSGTALLERLVAPKSAVSDRNKPNNEESPHGISLCMALSDNHRLRYLECATLDKWINLPKLTVLTTLIVHGRLLQVGAFGPQLTTLSVGNLDPLVVPYLPASLTRLSFASTAVWTELLLRHLPEHAPFISVVLLGNVNVRMAQLLMPDTVFKQRDELIAASHIVDGKEHLSVMQCPEQYSLGLDMLD